MKNIFLFICLGLISIFSFGKDTNVMDFGAVNDGKTLTTETIQKAIDQCASTGGGTVTVPQGTYLTHTIFLKSGVNLYLQKGCKILGDTNPEAFTRAIIFADSIENAAITGQGVIDGQGFAKYFPTTGRRHNDLCLYKCRNMTVSDITLRDSPTWVFRILQCDWVMVRGVKVYSYVNQNNDGIDIDAKNVTISDCIVDSEDDAICLKSDSPDFIVENIAITNCIIGTNCNAIKFGTSSRGGFRNIAISNCVIRWPGSAAKIPPRSSLKGCEKDTIMEMGLALEVVDGGFMDQVVVTNLTMTGIQTPLFIRLGDRKGPGTLKNVVISNITATDETLLNSSITGIPGSYVENVIVRDLIFKSKGTGTMTEAMAEVPEKTNSYPQANGVFGYSIPAYGMYVRHVKNLTLENFIFKVRAPDARPAVMLDDCHNIRINSFDADTPTDNQPLIRIKESTNVTVSGYQSVETVSNLLKAEGKSTRDIKLMNNDLSRVKEVVKFSDGCLPASVKMLNNIK